MTYVVLARKWRPQRFEELTGQEHVARTLQNAISSERIPHAVLFTGPRGVGKTSSARILSMALNCEQGPTPTPCGTCQACKEVKNGRSVDILEIDGASNRGINEIRELRDSVQYAPSRDRFKVYIIDEVHMLTTEAFNALLKTLEEPPPHVVFIFATTEPQKLPVTIISRCQRFDFREIGLVDMIGRLEHILSAEGIEAEPDALRMVARHAAGGMRDALSLLDQVISSSDGTITAERTADLLGATDRRLLFTLSEAILARDAGRALETLQRALQRGTDTSWLAAEFASHMRDLAVIAVAGPQSDLTILSPDEMQTAQAQVAQSDVATLEVLLDLILEAAEDISRATMSTLRFELALIRMCQVPSQQRIDHLITLLEAHAGLPTPLADLPQRSTTPKEPAASTAIEAPSNAADLQVRTPHPTPPPSKAPAPQTPVPVTPAPAPAAASEPAPNEATDRTVDAVANDVPTPAAHAEDAPTDRDTLEADTREDTDNAARPDETPAPQEPTAPAAAKAQDEDAPHTDTMADPVPVTDDEATPAADEPSAPHADTAPTPDDTATRVDDPATSDATAQPAAEPATDDESSEPKDVREPTLETWREAVNSLDDTLQFSRRMLAMGYCLPQDGVFRVGVVKTYVKEREDLTAAFQKISQQIFGRPWTLELVEDTSLTDAERARAWRIRTQEEEEEEALRMQIQTRIEAHPLIQSIKKRYPEYALDRKQLEFLPLDDGSSIEEEDDL